jgi:hypothetical protein
MPSWRSGQDRSGGKEIRAADKERFFVRQCAGFLTSIPNFFGVSSAASCEGDRDGSSHKDTSTR